jgi:hypothetical protein
MRRQFGGGGKRQRLAALIALVLFALGVWLLLGTRLDSGFGGWPVLGRLVESLRGRAPDPSAPFRGGVGLPDERSPEPAPGGSAEPVLAAPAEGIEPAASEPAGPVAREPLPQEGGLPRFRGAVHDAANGRGIPGARLRATAYHGTRDLAYAGIPALRTLFTSSDENGLFEIEAMAPHDPRLLLHLQVEHASYAPAVTVLERGLRADGLWEPAEILLRRALTLPVQLVDLAGRPLAGAPLQVTQRFAGHTFIDAPAVEISRGGRLGRPGEPRVHFTDPAGMLRLAFSDHAYEIILLHPEHHLRRLEGGEPTDEVELDDHVSLLLPREGLTRLLAPAGKSVEHLLLDRDLRPIALAEIEVALEGVAPRRLLTDPRGRLRLGLLPHDRRDQALGVRRPRRGRLTVLTPEYWNRSVEIALPSPREEIFIDARPAGRLRFRLAGATLPAPFSPEGVAISLDLTLVRLESGGLVEYRGQLPAPGTRFTIFANGFLPVEAMVPAAASDVADLGEVSLERGWSREVALSGAGAAALRGARLVASFPGEAREEHRHAAPASGRLVLGGLRPGPVRLTVEGPFLRPFTRVFELGEEDRDGPLEIELEAGAEEEVVVSGRVIDLHPLEAAGAEVIERFLVAGREEPLLMPPYPLAPDGSFGSIRRLAGVMRAHVAVVSPARRSAEEYLERQSGRALFDAGELRYRDRVRAEISFVAEGLGRVDPPLQAAIEGEQGIGAIARLGWKDRKLVADNLHPGAYRLQWRSGPAGHERDEAMGFEVLERSGELALVARRSPFAEERIEVRITDSRGAPLEEAAITPVAPPPQGFEPEPGVKLALAHPGAPTRFTVSAPGFLPARVEAEAGQPIPREVVLARKASIEARALDGAGQPLSGTVLISWELQPPGSIAYGEPLAASAEHGRLVAHGLPAVLLSFTFRLEGSGLSSKRELLLAETAKRQDLGVLRFEEKRALRGSVVLAGGLPAARATVALLPSAEAYRFPLRAPLDFSRARHRTEADVQGRFVLEDLPAELPAKLALVGHLEGWSDAVVEPLDPDLPFHDLLLLPAAALDVNAGYRDRSLTEDYRFTLEYQRDPTDPGSRIELGEIVHQLFGIQRYSGIQPGLYRLKWGLRDAYPPLPGIWQEVQAMPGTFTSLYLPVEGRTLRGSVRFNGKPLERGWVLLTDSPGVNGAVWVGRIRDGAFVLVDPPQAFRAFAAVIPERKPQPFQNLARGEGVPVPLHNYRSALRSGRLDLEQAAHDVTLRFSPAFLTRHQRATLHFESQEWDGNSFRPVPAREPIGAPSVTFHLLAPGPWRFSIRSERDSLIHSRTVMLRESQQIELR